jgi:hypothetical protein
MAQLNFDATKVEPDAGFDTVPVGWYNAAIDESELKPTKDGSGTYLQLRFNILDGQYRGRKLFSRLNIRNASTEAQEIALRQLSAIGHAVGVLHIQDSQQLHGIAMKVKVKIRPASADGQYEAQNEIIVYKNINEPVETVGSGQGAGAPQQQGFAPQQPQGFQQPQQGFQQPQPQQQFAPQPQQQPVQQFQQPVQQQPQQQQFQAPAPDQQQPWAQAPIAGAPGPQQDPNNPFGGQQQPQQQPMQQPIQQEQPTQQQPWQQGAPQQQIQQQPAQQDPNAGAAAQAQQAPPPWAQGGQQG